MEIDAPDGLVSKKTLFLPPCVVVATVVVVVHVVVVAVVVHVVVVAVGVGVEDVVGTGVVPEEGPPLTVKAASIIVIPGLLTTTS